MGAGQGQPNRIEALEQLTIPRARKVLTESKGNISDCILISDAFFPFKDSIEMCASGRIAAIIQPGGSIKDKEIIDACDKYNIAMLFTGIRHFRH